MNPTKNPEPLDSERVPTGVAGLDEILMGGLPKGHLYLLEGTPGTGKTTIALQFLLEGARRGEKVLYVTLSESSGELLVVAASHGWNLDNVNLLELNTLDRKLKPDEDYTVYHPSEVELSETTQRIYADIERLSPQRVVFDSLSEMRLLAADPVRYRRQILALKQFFFGKEATVLLLDDHSGQATDLQLQSISHGVIQLERVTTPYSDMRRRLNVVKMRGIRFFEGYHDFMILRGGVEAYPRLVAANKRQRSKERMEYESIDIKIPDLDALMGASVSPGASVLVIGPAGSGKSNFAMQYLWKVAQQGKHGVAYLFEENKNTYLKRARGLGMPLEEHIASGKIVLHQEDAATLSPGEFANRIQTEVEQKQAQIVVIDSLNGFLNAMPNEQFLLIQMHELLMYLNDRRVLTFIILAQNGMMGAAMQSPLDVSYLADMVVMMRFFEAAGEVRKAVSIIKNRNAIPEATIREYKFVPDGIRIGQPLTEFEGILTGTPRFTGQRKTLLSVPKKPRAKP